MNYKPFDLEAAKRGEPIQTRDGRKIKFVTHVPEADQSYRVVCMYDSGTISGWGEDGRLCPSNENDGDLFMAPKKRTVEFWLNVYAHEDGHLDTASYPSERKADYRACLPRLGNKAHHVVIEWEE